MVNKYSNRAYAYLIIAICYSTLLLTTSCSKQEGKFSMNDQFEQAGPSKESDHSEYNVFPCFMPDQDCVPEIVKWIHNAQKSIIVQAYSFSSEQIANALINSKQKGKDVKIFIDKDAETKQGNLIQKLRSEGIQIQVDQQVGRAHNKVMIIDDEYVITGSYNWTDSHYDNNSDVIIFVRDECVNKKYIDNYNYNVKINQMMNSSQRGIFSPLNTRLDRCCTISLFNLSGNTTMRHDDDGFTTVSTKNKKQKQKSKNFVEVDVCFPRYDNQNCISLIVHYINNAKKSIFIQACSLTHDEISKALISTHKRNIDIKLLVDQKAFSDTNQKVSDLIKRGIEVKCDTTCHPGIAHSKTIIIDYDIVLTGSLNLTRNAQNSNSENLLRMSNTHVNVMFKKNFCKKWEKGKKVDNDTCVMS
ncbi:phospholipase D-like domain-containing protein [Candidatus Cardinium hertigii]|uniref:phospholipase D-like domain-containing protein n=3 Tax=Candidatus Cardinium TaxID=273135 RepID=UPI001FA9CA7B|nr:phospholipase D-like domain-containing protein [Candidatus Cardinium hertigii]